MKFIASIAIAVAGVRIKATDAEWYQLTSLVKGCCASFGLGI